MKEQSFINEIISVLKKNNLGVWQIACLKQHCFLSFTFYKTQISYKRIMCICYFIGSVVKILLYLHFLYTKDDRPQQIKKKHE